MRLGLVLGNAATSAVSTYERLGAEERAQAEEEYLKEKRAQERAYIRDMTKATAAATGTPYTPEAAPTREPGIMGALRRLTGRPEEAAAPASAPTPAPTASAPAPAPAATPAPLPPPVPTSPILPLARQQGDAPSAIRPGLAAPAAPMAESPPPAAHLAPPPAPTAAPAEVKRSVLDGYRPPSDYYQTMAMAAAKAGKGEEAQGWLGKFYAAKADAAVALVAQAAESHGNDGVLAVANSIADGTTMTITPIAEGPNKGLSAYTYGDVTIVAGSASEFAIKFSDRVRGDPVAYVEHTLKFEDRRSADALRAIEMQRTEAQIRAADQQTAASKGSEARANEMQPYAIAGQQADTAARYASAAASRASASDSYSSARARDRTAGGAVAGGWEGFTKTDPQTGETTAWRKQKGTGAVQVQTPYGFVMPSMQAVVAEGAADPYVRSGAVKMVIAPDGDVGFIRGDTRTVFPTAAAANAYRRSGSAATPAAPARKGAFNGYSTSTTSGD